MFDAGSGTAMFARENQYAQGLTAYERQSMGLIDPSQFDEPKIEASSPIDDMWDAVRDIARSSQ